MTDFMWKFADLDGVHYSLEGNGDLWIYENISEEEYRSYISYLSNVCGMQLYAESLLGKNPSHTFLWQNNILHTYFTANKNRIHVIVEPISGLYHGLPPQKEAYECITTPTFAVMALDYRTQKPTDANGMSYVFRLVDGSFVIYDGGYLQDAQNLYTYLRDHTPFADGKIVISAWILTHSHIDHYSCFLGFSRMFASKVEVKRFLLNSPAGDPAVVDLRCHDNFLNSSFFECAKKYPQAKLIHVHTGQVISLAGAEIEVLQTYEDILPERIKWLNEASLVTRMRIEEQSFLFPADAEIKADRALERYGNYLKSDFLQITHHGYSGGTLFLMDAIDPRYVLWTTDFECYSLRTVRKWHSGINRYLLSCKSVEYSFVGDGCCKILKLPFRSEKDVEYYRYSGNCKTDF